MTTWQFTPFLLPIVVAAVMSALLAAFAWRRRQAHAAGTLFIIAALACLWSAAYALEVASTTLSAKLFWVRIEYLAIATLPVAWLVFAMRFSQRDALVTRRNVILLLIVPAITLVLVWTEPAHGLYYGSLDVRMIEGLSYFAPQYGPWFWVHSLYSYACYVAGVVFIFQRLRETSGVYQQQAEIVLIGSLPPFVTSFVFVFAPTTLDPAPVAFALSSLFFTWGLFRLRLLDRPAEPPQTDTAVAGTSLADTLAATRLRILNIVFRGLALLGGVLMVVSVLGALQQRPVDAVALVVLVALYAVFFVVALVERLPFALRATFLLLVLYLFAFNNIRTAGLDVDAGITLFAFTAIAFILFGRAIGIGAMVVSLLTLGFGGWQIVTGELVVTPTYVAGAGPWTILVPLASFALFLGAILLSQVSLLDTLQTQLNRSRELARQLEEERTLLEQRVTDRTRALSISATLSRQLSTILDPDILVEEVVTRLQETFDYYHTHIYFLDETAQVLRMVGGTGEPAREMARRGHKLPVGVGLVGRAAATGTTVFARDVSQEPNWQRNPLLPNTRSEIAVPIQFANQVLGVLDVQQNMVDGFGTQDMDLLQSVANQLAVVLRNARLYAEARRQAEHEALLNQINQRIMQTTDVESALKVAVLELGEALNAPQTEVRLAAESDIGNGRVPSAREVEQHGE